MAFGFSDGKSFYLASREHKKAANGQYSEANKFKSGLYLGYISGMADMIAVSHKEHICYPDGVYNGQLADLITAYLDNNPAKRHQYPAVSVFNAIAEAFPCK